MTLTYDESIVNEGSTAFYTFSLVDENGDSIALTELDAMVLTLTDDLTGGVLNSRSAQNVLNANGVTVSSVGAVSWEMSPGDNIIVGDIDPDAYEAHTAVFKWTWDSGLRSATEVFEFAVRKVARVAVAITVESIPMPALTGDVLADTLASLQVERLRVARAGPKVTYDLDGQRVDWNRYMEVLDKRILDIRIQIAQTTPVEIVSETW